MERTLRLRKGIRTIAVIGFLFFLSMGVVSVFGIFLDPPPNKQIPLGYLALFFGLFWGAMSSLSIWLLLAYRREKLTVSAELVSQHGVLRTKSVRIDEIKGGKCVRKQ